jgi:hypothetical protein
MFSLTDEQLAAQLFNLVLPLVVAWVLRPTWSDRTRAVTAFAVMLVAVALVQLALVNLAEVPNHWQSWLRFILTSLVVAAVSYQTFWKSTGLVQRMEAMTTPAWTAGQRAAKARLLAEARRKAMPPKTTDA